MKRNLLLAFCLLLGLGGVAQLSPVSADLGFANARLEDLSGNLLDANSISDNQVVRLKVAVSNFSGDADAPAGHFRIRIGLGAGFILNGGFSSSTALSDKFSWSLDNNGAQFQIVGTSIAPLEADYFGTAAFDLKANTPTVSTLSFNFLISNPPATQTPLSDPEPTNNSAANGYTIAQPLTFTQTTQNATCNGIANGSIAVMPSGGLPNPNYSFTVVNATTNTTYTASSSTTSNFNNLAPGSYNITVADAFGNTATGTTSITQPPAITVNTPVQSVINCNGGLATVTINASGGTGTLTYTLGTNSNTTGIFNNVPANAYTYSVTDQNNCGPFGSNFTVVQPAAIGAAAAQSVINCNGGTATVTVSATGGTGNYSYSFANGPAQTGNTFSNIPAGTYSYTVTDANGCGPFIGNITVNQPAAIAAGPVSQTLILCNGGTATVTIPATGGTGTLNYTFNGSTNQTGMFTNVPAGNYTYSVTDANNCTAATGPFTVTQPTLLVIGTVGKTNNSCNGGANGSITVPVSGGTPGYSFTINGPTVNNTGAVSGTFTGLTAGSYTVTIKDANNCTAVTNTIIVTQPLGTAPDMTLSVADYSDNYFPAGSTEVTLIFQLNEIGGNPSLKDTLRLTKQADYQYTLLPPGTAVVNGITYNLDNARWTADNSQADFFNVGLNTDQQIGCGQSVYIGIKLRRSSANKAVFSLTSRLRGVTGEVNTANNTAIIVLVGQ